MKRLTVACAAWVIAGVCLAQAPYNLTNQSAMAFRVAERPVIDGLLDEVLGLG